MGIAGLKNKTLTLNGVETSAHGRRLHPVFPVQEGVEDATLILFPEKRYQTLVGIGGSFTASSAALFHSLSNDSQNKILEAYFGDDGARYSLTRTHINSCDFSPKPYCYAPVADDTQLKYFSIAPDQSELIPFIKRAQKVSSEGFKIIASPWTAPPWMKDNNSWAGGVLLPKYYKVWANYFVRYLRAYQKQGIDIWGITVENEPLGNDENWESMHYSPEQMNFFVENYLGPVLKSGEHADVKILGYDQNREHLKEWVDKMYEGAAAKFYDGTAIHWYASTYKIFEKALNYAHQKAPNKYLIQTEACVDAQKPAWQDDHWYWKSEATDWGYYWAKDDDKKNHPKYVPVYRYARDIIGCLNNWVQGWIDWNMLLDRQGGPNWAQNWCTAPVIVDPQCDEVYLTPLYDVMTHFSRYIRPNATRIGLEISNSELLATAVQNTDGSIVVILLNQTDTNSVIDIEIHGSKSRLNVSRQALQTWCIPSTNEQLN